MTANVRPMSLVMALAVGLAAMCGCKEKITISTGENYFPPDVLNTALVGDWQEVGPDGQPRGTRFAIAADFGFTRTIARDFTFDAVASPDQLAAVDGAAYGSLGFGGFGFGQDNGQIDIGETFQNQAATAANDLLVFFTTSPRTGRQREVRDPANPLTGYIDEPFSWEQIGNLVTAEKIIAGQITGTASTIEFASDDPAMLVFVQFDSSAGTLTIFNQTLTTAVANPPTIAAGSPWTGETQTTQDFGGVLNPPITLISRTTVTADETVMSVNLDTVTGTPEMVLFRRNITAAYASQGAEMALRPRLTGHSYALDAGTPPTLKIWNLTAENGRAFVPYEGSVMVLGFPVPFAAIVHETNVYTALNPPANFGVSDVPWASATTPGEALIFATDGTFEVRDAGSAVIRRGHWRLDGGLHRFSDDQEFHKQ